MSEILRSAIISLIVGVALCWVAEEVLVSKSLQLALREDLVQLALTITGILIAILGLAASQIGGLIEKVVSARRDDLLSIFMNLTGQMKVAFYELLMVVGLSFVVTSLAGAQSPLITNYHGRWFVIDSANMALVVWMIRLTYDIGKFQFKLFGAFTELVTRHTNGSGQPK